MGECCAGGVPPEVVLRASTQLLEIERFKEKEEKSAEGQLPYLVGEQIRGCRRATKCGGQFV
jgi:hypothetical protein